MVSNIHYDNTTGFLNICCGGVGLEAGEVFSSRYLADGRAFPQVLVHIDTDPIEAAFVEHRIHIGLDGGMLDALRADPEKFGPEAVTILKKHAQSLCSPRYWQKQKSKQPRSSAAAVLVQGGRVF